MTTAKAGPGTQNKDIVSIQALRGIASLLVVLSHCFPLDKYPETNILRYISLRGGIGVHIFFIISGYIIPYSMYKNKYQIKNIGVFFAKRMVRIEPPYIVSIILILLFAWLSAFSPWAHTSMTYQPDWKNIMGHLCYLNAFTKQPWLSPVYWTLALEFMFYIILALFYPLLTSSQKGVLIATFYCFLSLSFTRNLLPYYLLQHHTVFFALGIALFLFHIGKINRVEYAVLTLSCFIACYMLYAPLFSWVALAALLFIHFVTRIPKVLWALGTISYSLYLTHAIVASRFEALFVKLIPSLSTGTKFTLGLLGCIAFAAVFYYFIERPFQKISKNIGYKKPATPAQ